jgi:ribonuclease HI
MKPYILYVDGACTNNGRPNAKAGWGAVLTNPQGDTLELAAPLPPGDRQTNQRAELMAALVALSRCKPGAPITLISDSQYVIKGINEWMPGWKARGWKKKDKSDPDHLDLWLLVDAQLQLKDITAVWVEGHAGNPGNMRADALANLGAAGQRVEKRIPAPVLDPA